MNLHLPAPLPSQPRSRPRPSLSRLALASSVSQSCRPELASARESTVRRTELIYILYISHTKTKEIKRLTNKRSTLTHLTVCVLILLHMWRQRRLLSHTTINLACSYYYISSVPILLYVCPHTTICLASPYYYICVLILLCI
jgi:hypothetical protein